MKRTAEVLETFISQLDLSGQVQSFSDDGTNTLLIVDNPLHARIGMPIEVFEISGGTSTVVISATDTSIEVMGVFADPLSFQLNPPFYFHGTPIAVNNYLSGADDELKYPMIYLYEVFQEVDQDEYNGIDYISSVRLFFLDLSKYEDWNTDDHYQFVIDGMNRLIDEFKKQMSSYGLFYQEAETYTRTAHANFGVFVENQGHIKHLFDDFTSGVQLRFNINVRKNLKCFEI